MHDTPTGNEDRGDDQREEPPDQPHPLDQPSDPVDGPDAEAAVLALGLEVEDLRHSVVRGYLTSRDMSGGHWPVATGPFVGWAGINKFLRDRTAPKRWAIDETENVPKAVSPDGSFAVTALRGNEYTGLKMDHPSTARPRGAGGKRTIIDGWQIQLPFEEDVESPPPPKVAYLLYHLHETRDTKVIRYELSVPWEIDESGHVQRWHNRFILPEIVLTGPTKSDRRGSDDTEEDSDLSDQQSGGA